MAVALGQRLLPGASVLNPVAVGAKLPARCQLRSRLVVVAERRAEDDGTNRRRSDKGKSYSNSRRRKGRPAHTRTPYDSPLRDGNRDRLIGLLTERSVKTLLCYLMETNLNLYHWLLAFLTENPIPRNGNWDDVSGETFLRTLLAMPVQEAKFATGRDEIYDNIVSCGVDPRSIAQRIMEIRSQLSTEFIQELNAVDEENRTMLRETLDNSFLSSQDLAVADETPALKLPTLDSAAPSADTAQPAAAAATGSTQLPPEVEALIKAAYPGGQTPENIHPEILEMIQQSAPNADLSKLTGAVQQGTAAPDVLPAAPQAVSVEVDKAPAVAAAAAADDVVGTMDGASEVQQSDTNADPSKLTGAVQQGAAVTDALPAAPLAANVEVDNTPAAAAAATADDLVGTMDGSLEAAGGSPDDLVITNVTGHTVVLGSGGGEQAVDKAVAAGSVDSAQLPQAGASSADGPAGDEDATRA